MHYDKLIFHEDLWPDVLGRTLTLDFRRGELELRETEGVLSCCITSAECVVFRGKLDLSHMDIWAESYHPSVSAMILDGNSWYLKLFDGKKLVRETHGCNGLPPALQWNTFYSVIARSYLIARARGILRSDETMERPCF